MAMRIIFGTKTKEGTGGWRKFHNEELHNCRAVRKYSSRIAQSDLIFAIWKADIHNRFSHYINELYSCFPN
jgi:hypothetical protein